MYAVLRRDVPGLNGLTALRRGEQLLAPGAAATQTRSGSEHNSSLQLTPMAEMNVAKVTATLMGQTRRAPLSDSNLWQVVYCRRAPPTLEGLEWQLSTRSAAQSDAGGLAAQQHCVQDVDGARWPVRVTMSMACGASAASADGFQGLETASGAHCDAARQAWHLERV